MGHNLIVMALMVPAMRGKIFLKHIDGRGVFTLIFNFMELQLSRPYMPRYNQSLPVAAPPGKAAAL
jgi:hypothetical protein